MREEKREWNKRREDGIGGRKRKSEDREKGRK